MSDTANQLITAENLPDYLGPQRYLSEVAERTSEAGVATGLAWTPVGGDIIFVECSRMPGKGSLVLTGQLGDVMKESAQAALSWVRAHARQLGIEESFFERVDLHLHVPEGAIPKDGPSAGITMAVSLVSALLRIPVRRDVAMTGEITLRGRVLPVYVEEEVPVGPRAHASRSACPTRVPCPARCVTRTCAKAATGCGRRDRAPMGPSIDNFWLANLTNRLLVAIVGFENLTGAGNGTSDAFTFESTGSLSGTVNGGDGTFDAIRVAKTSGGYTVFNPLAGSESGGSLQVAIDGQNECRAIGNFGDLGGFVRVTRHPHLY